MVNFAGRGYSQMITDFELGGKGFKRAKHMLHNKCMVPKKTFFIHCIENRNKLHTKPKGLHRVLPHPK